MENNKLTKSTQCITREELAARYGVCRRTLYSWLNKAGIQLKQKSRITPKELAAIVAVLGE